MNREERREENERGGPAPHADAQHHTAHGCSPHSGGAARHSVWAACRSRRHSHGHSLPRRAAHTPSLARRHTRTHTAAPASPSPNSCVHSHLASNTKASESKRARRRPPHRKRKRTESKEKRNQETIEAKRERGGEKKRTKEVTYAAATRVTPGFETRAVSLAMRAFVKTALLTQKRNKKRKSIVH